MHKSVEETCRPLGRHQITNESLYVCIYVQMQVACTEEQRIQTLDNLDGEEPGIEDGDAGPAVLF